MNQSYPVKADALTQKEMKYLEESTHHQFRAPYPVDENPKSAAAVGKLRMSVVPIEPLKETARVYEHGADKYGVMNWRKDAITASTYYDAIERHLMAWFGGEDMDPESGRHHLAHIAASCGIVMDAELHNKLNDDRDE